MRRCPCGERTSPDPNCDLCDAWIDEFNDSSYEYPNEEREEYSNNPFDDKDKEERDTDLFG